MGEQSEGAQFVNWFGPLLDALRKLGGSGSPDEVTEQIATDQGVPDAAQNELTSSGQPRFKNQVAWARFYLTKAGLLSSSKRGVWSLTEQGRTTTLTYEQAHEIFRHWVAVFQEQRREEAQESFKQEALASWAAYKETGHHLTGQEVRTWLNTWGTDEEKTAPECHNTPYKPDSTANLR